MLQSQYQTQQEPRPVFELALRWRRARVPVTATPVLVHGDYRHGNLIIGARGIHAVLDWELAHRGDPLEDLAWLCLPPWCFGAIDLPVGGFGRREALLEAYERAGNTRVDLERLYRHHRRYRITEGSEEIQMRKVAAYLFGFAGPRRRELHGER